MTVDLLVERWQVCLGLGPGDPAAVVLLDNILTPTAAQSFASQMLAQQDAFDATYRTDRTFFVRQRPGQQTAVIDAADPGGVPTRQEIESNLVTAPTTNLVLYVRHLNPNGFLRWGTMPVSAARQLSA